MLDPLLAAITLVALLLLLFLRRRHVEEARSLREHLDAVELHNRRLSDEKARLEREAGERILALQALKRDVAALEEVKLTLEGETETLRGEKRTLEERREALEKTRVDLEGRLTALRTEHESLEKRVVGFQGEWSRQLTTLEEEIGTLIRQLGEFRKGTRLPVADENAPKRGIPEA